MGLGRVTGQASTSSEFFCPASKPPRNHPGADGLQGGDGYPVGVDAIVDRPLQIIQQLVGRATQHHRADLALGLRLLQHDDVAAADVLRGNALRIADLVRAGGAHLDQRTGPRRPAKPDPDED